MRKPIQPSLDSTVRAAIHRSGGVLRIVIAAVRGRGPSIVEAVDVPEGDLARAAGILGRHRVSRVIEVVPAARAICRTFTLPNADQEQLAAALALQLETLPLGDVPPHRIASAILPAAPGETSRVGVVVAWPGEPAPPVQHAGETRYVPEQAALCALLDDQRPASPLVGIDPVQGEVSLALVHAGGVMLRGTRVGRAGERVQETIVAAVIAESAIAAGHTRAFADSLAERARAGLASIRTSDGLTLLLPDELIPIVRSRFDQRVDETWIRRYGIAAGALLADAGALAPLAGLRDHVAAVRPSRLATIVAALGRPSVAVRAVAAAILVLALLPLFSAGLRLSVLHLRFAGIEERSRATEDVRTRLAIYEAMQASGSLPITKVLGDLMTNAPRGVELDIVRVTTGAGEFRLQGSAAGADGESPQQLLSRLSENLTRTGIFSDVNLRWGEANKLGGYGFELSGRVVQPFREFAYPVTDDFGRWTLSARLSGDPPPGDSVPAADSGRSAAGTPDRTETPAPGTPDRATATARAPDTAGGPGRTAAAPATDDGRSDRPHRTIGPGIGDRERTGAPLPGTGGDAIDPNLIPEPLTEAQILAMSESELRSALTTYSNAVSRLSRPEDAELRAAIRATFSRIMARLGEISPP